MPARRLLPEELERLMEAQPALPEPLSAGVDTALLQQLVSMDRGLLAKMMSERRYAAGEIVFEEGAEGKAMYLIQSGRVVAVKGDWATPTVLGYRGPGEFVGEMALLEEKPRSATIVALEDLHLLRISRKKFHQLLSREPAVGMRIMETLSARLRAASVILTAGAVSGRDLVHQVSELRQQSLLLVELQRVRQETRELIVYELRNPLSAIQAAVQMLQLVLPEEILTSNRQLLAIIHSSTTHMQQLVDSLVDVAQLESGEFQLRLAPTNLLHLFAEVVGKVALSTEGREVQIESVTPPKLPSLVLDRDLIGRVVTHLVNNAVRDMPAGGRIELAAEVQDDYVVVSVTDAGPGLPPEDREGIFQGGAAQGRPGFDLNLTFCKLAVEAHGGRIWVEPGEGGLGNRFAFTVKQ